MTKWDFIDKYLAKGPLYLLLLSAIAVIFLLISKPSIAREWNINISTLIAAFFPWKRKKIFEKRVLYTVLNAKEKMNEYLPPNMHSFLPYDMKIKWVHEQDSIESLINDDQIILYVPNYKDEAKQTIGILYNYCEKGFVDKTKVYMSERTKQATDLVMTGKLAQYAGSHIFDYFNRTFIPDIINNNTSIKIAYDNLKLLDVDGIFVPIYINELDKLSNIIYPTPPSDEIESLITNFGNFIISIVKKRREENVPLSFIESFIRIEIVLAVSTIDHIDKIIENLDEDIKSKRYNTIYIIASGEKIDFACEIADKVFKNNIQELYEPIETRYFRNSRFISKDAVCCELNICN